MDKFSAIKTIKSYYRIANPSEDDKFLFTEALRYLIEVERDPAAMMDLGGFYYGQKQFDLALKYYEMAAQEEYTEAYSCLGYVWYYGRTGTVDYKKAFECFSKCMQKGDLIATYKVADMYRNGYFVDKDMDKYKSMIEELYPKVKDLRNLGEPVPEVFTRLARIRAEEGREDEAVDLYLRAKDFLAQRISYNAFFGNLNIMDWLINDLYKLLEFDDMDFDLFDLYYLLKKPAKVSFWYEQKMYQIESVMEDGNCVIRFGNKWYRNVSDFLSKATVKNKPIVKINQDLYGFEVE